MTSTFVKRQISLKFRLQSTQFQGTGSNTLELSGLKTEIHYSQSGGVTSDAVRVTIWGMTASQMNSLATYGMPPDVQFNNEVSVSAGDAVSGMTLIFQGTITSAVTQYGNDGAFVVEAYAYQYIKIAPAASNSYKGSVDVAVIMANLATRMNLRLESNGVSVILSNPYLSGSLVDQMRSCAKAANINAYLDSQNGVLAIWPKNQTRGSKVIAIGPDNGLVGYPEFSYQSIKFTTLFNPNIFFWCQIRMTSSLKPACGIFVAGDIETHLMSETPDGPWFQHIEAWQPAHASLAAA